MARLAKEPFTAKCAWCEREFVSQDRGQRRALNSGNSVYCSSQCSSAMSRSKRPWLMYGPCPTCGKAFKSQKPKKYCSMDCYTSSPEFQERMRTHNLAQRGPEHACPQCGKVFWHKYKKFCNNTCRRLYFAERFDRFIANPEAVALPQCFDEFLTKPELPCPFVGCNWSGVRLGQHVNITHGITAEKFKELAGFNKTTGLVTPELRAAMSEHFKGLIAKGLILPEHRHVGPMPSAAGRHASLEATEHAKKSRRVKKATHEPTKFVPCRFCQQPVPQPAFGSQQYCNPKCRTAYYEREGKAELTCSFCGAVFMGNLYKVTRARKGEKVCCSDDCRNRMNMVACLAARGIDWSGYTAEEQAAMLAENLPQATP